MKVFIVIQHGDNGEQFEDYRSYSEVHSVYSSLELANKAIDNLPKEEIINREIKYAEGFTGDTNCPEPWYETDENGELVYEYTYNPISYSVVEKEVIE